MNFVIVATYLVLGGLILLLLKLLIGKREKNDIEINDAILGPEELEKHAVEIARSHNVSKNTRLSNWLIPRMNENYRVISEAYKSLNDDVRGMKTTAPAAEWLLDNFYIIDEQIKDIRQNLSRGYYSGLPGLKSGPLMGYPRVYDIALELVAHTDGRLDEKLLVNFIRSYQTQALLSSGELWAAAIMVRIALIENIRHICEKVMESQCDWRMAEEMAELLLVRLDRGQEESPSLIQEESPSLIQEESPSLIQNESLALTKEMLQGMEILSPSYAEHLLQRLRNHGGKASFVIHYLDEKLAGQDTSAECITQLEHQLQAARQVSIGNSITSLRLVSVMDWAEIFEHLSQVEQILKQDPDGTYSLMDFASRDYYRHDVGKIAKMFRTSETQIARKAIDCAREAVESGQAGWPVTGSASIEGGGDSGSRPLSHVGYYIVGKGKKKLIDKIGYNPKGLMRFACAVKKHPLALYLGSIGFITVFVTAWLVYYAGRQAAGLPALMMVPAALAVLIPAGDIAVAIVNWIISHTYKPSILPKLELEKGIPQELSTMVVIPTLLPNEKRVMELVGQLEIFYLSNREENLYFALVGDYKDARAESMPEDRKIIEAALDGIKDLNERYSRDGREIFFYFHRHRQYNAIEDRWMGWERKRGAIMEFNDLLHGAADTGYSIVSGDLSRLPLIKYVITLDADTNLPMGTARALIGTMAHPLNRPVIDRETGVVLEGHGLLQPRISVSIMSANSSLFSRIFAGQGGIDPYTTAVSDIYQDLFGEGIFTGKGIYDVDVFRRALKNVIPENTILSHDLLEGSYVRAGLATDIELIDGYPSRYNSYAMRLHRWVRGDWQLMPWLCKQVRDRKGNKVKNPLSVISRWKILDNMRRSLLAPALMTLLALGFSILPGNSLVWVGLAFITTAFPVLTGISDAVLSGSYRSIRERRHATIICGLKAVIYQVVLLFIFLPYQAYLMADAIIRTLYRVLFSGRNLLEWVTAADMEARLKNDLKSFLVRMWVSALEGAAIFVLAVLFSPLAVPLAALLLFLWTAAPVMAYRISKIYPEKPEPLSANDLQQLRRLARKTWRYFEDFAGPSDNYLPPDNFQEEPLNGIAHRTSPTNIGLLLVSTMSARDLGYIGTVDMLGRLNNTISTMEKMEKWKGHLYNWYNTITLKTMRPLYVSTVDSGNLIGYLMVLQQGLKEYMNKPPVDQSLALGLKDTISLLGEEVNDSDLNLELELELDTSVLDRFIAAEKVDLAEWKKIVNRLLNDLGKSGTGRDPRRLTWRDRLLSAAASFEKELVEIMPWVNIAPAMPECINSDRIAHAQIKPLIDEITGKLSDNPSLARLPVIYRDAVSVTGRIIAAFKSNVSFNSEECGKVLQWLELLGTEFEKAGERVEKVTELFEDLINRLQRMIKSMKFAPLFDARRQLFSIGYNVEEGALSKSYYDLLASEARQASYIAIARGEIDQKHWFRLGRALTMIDRFKGLVSWTGTMFEYLMPLLIMRNYKNTLLDETHSFVVRNHKKYGEQRHIPWGVSESGYSAFDINLNYQYKAFGVPELGLKRGLANDMVIAPYATVLALPIDPEGAVRNIMRLTAEGLDGGYGLYEAVDYTPSRLQKGRKSSIVKSFMAHHQGMSLVALNNYLNCNIMQRRFHADPFIRAAELLLQERIPTRVMFTKEYKEEVVPIKKIEQEDAEVIRTFGTPDTVLPHVHILSNGSYSVMITNGGSGYSRKHDIAVTRWREAISGASRGMFIFIQNINSNMVWSAAYEPLNEIPDMYRVVFSPDKAEFMRKDGNMDTHTEIVVSPEDNAEIRRVSLTNHSRYTRILEVTSYFEVVIAPQAVDLAHPAFSNLFVRTEFIPDYDCLIAARRPRNESQKPLWASHVIAVEGDAVGEIQYETDRSRFIGRGRSLSNPVALEVDQPLTNTAGPVLDPIMSLRRRVRVESGQTVRISYTVAVAESRKAALELAEKYHDPKASERAFELAWTRSRIETRYLGLAEDKMELYQYMLPHIIYLSPLRRTLEGKIIINRKGQSDLWPFGISGDIPIVLVRISNIDETDMVYQILKAHEYWRMKGLMVDLVILNEDAGSYLQTLQDAIRDIVSASHAREMVDRPGGVFVRQAALLPEDDRILLFTAARIVLNGDGGSLREQVRMDYAENTPAFCFVKSPEEQTLYPSPAAALPELDFFNGIGGFDDGGREYVIYLHEGQQTPAPWINVISNCGFGFQVSESGSGYIWSENSRENKLTPWSNDPVSDPPGEVFYVRDEASGSFWSLTPLPVREKGPYTIRHGHGYSVFEHISHGIRQQLTEFVPVDDPVKICIVRLKNLSDAPRELSVTYYIKTVLGVNEQITAQYITTQVHNDTGMLLVQNSYNIDFPGRIAFMDASVNYSGRSFTCDNREFIGINKSLKEPEAMKRIKLSGRTGAGFDPCAALQMKIGLSAGEEREIVFLLGQGRNIEEALGLAGKYRDVEKAKDAFMAVKEFWKDKLGAIQVSTPDRSMNYMLNGWLLYQVISCRLWARSAFYQSGGAYGFRDQLQDVMAVAYTWPEVTRMQILLHSMHQFVDGDVLHWWHPGAEKGIRSRYSDDLVWLAYVTSDYIRCTGDWAILDEQTVYLDGELLGEHEDERYSSPRHSEQKSTVYEHCIRAIEWALKSGEHGIPLMGSGDWNDGMNTVGNKGRGESIWLGWFLYTTLINFIPVCKGRNDMERAAKYTLAAESVAEAIEKNAWDGSWYLRAYFDDGTALGSAQNTECKMDSIAQSWSAISGAGRPKRVEEAMNAVDHYLVDRDEGLIKLLTPPFNNGNLNPGYIKGYVPGVRENGGQYTHAAAWVILAFARLGMGDKAWELFNLINPINHARTHIEYSRYKVEPYVMAADVYTVNPHSGRGGWTWYTGAAGWMYRVGVEHILGLKKLEGNLTFDPCIPAGWKEYTIKYKHNSATYVINVRNPNGVNKGVLSVAMDGKMQEDKTVYPVDDGAEHVVEVVMGLRCEFNSQPGNNA